MIVPTPGRIVQYRVAEDEYRPAIVVKVWSPEMVNLQVFLDGSNDYRSRFTVHECEHGIAWKTSVKEGDQVGEWRWPPRD